MFPEHDKLREVKNATQAAGEFMDFLLGKGLFLAYFEDGNHYPTVSYTPVRNLLAEWAGIDQDRLEDEKRAMLKALRDG